VLRFSGFALAVEALGELAVDAVVHLLAQLHQTKYTGKWGIYSSMLLMMLCTSRGTFDR
jgi:hypothetical protein